MKLLRYGPVGFEKPGVVDKDGVIRDLSNHVDDIAGDTLGQASLDRLASIELSVLPRVNDDVRIGPCVGSVGKFICVGLNYADHAEESGMALPSEPVLFMKATSAICGPNDAVIKPRESTKLDWEVELGVVIGKHASYVDAKGARDHIAGYCVINDISERAFQLEREGQWCKGKGCDTFGPIGPWLVTKDEIQDIDALDMWLDVNEIRFQDGNSRTMVYKTEFLVSYISQFMSLQPGDIISTGTPPGVGFGLNPPEYLDIGDHMRLGIEGLGEQRQVVIAPSL